MKISFTIFSLAECMCTHQLLISLLALEFLNLLFWASPSFAKTFAMNSNFSLRCNLPAVAFQPMTMGFAMIYRTHVFKTIFFPFFFSHVLQKFIRRWLTRNQKRIWGWERTSWLLLKLSFDLLEMIRWIYYRIQNNYVVACNDEKLAQLTTVVRSLFFLLTNERQPQLLGLTIFDPF